MHWSFCRSLDRSVDLSIALSIDHEVKVEEYATVFECEGGCVLFFLTILTSEHTKHQK
jgi:hypothetical protein